MFSMNLMTMTALTMKMMVVSREALELLQA
jgi:hypothetical protein